MDEWNERKSQVLARLARIEGQVRALSGMVEREEDCERVVQQMAAARKALDRAFFDLVACVAQRELHAAGARSPAALKQLAKVTDLLVRYG